MDNKIKSQKKVINLNCSYSVYSEKKIYEINSNIKENQTTPFISPVHPQKKPSTTKFDFMMWVGSILWYDLFDM